MKKQLLRSFLLAIVIVPTSVVAGTMPTVRVPVPTVRVNVPKVGIVNHPVHNVFPIIGQHRPTVFIEPGTKRGGGSASISNGHRIGGPRSPKPVLVGAISCGSGGQCSDSGGHHWTGTPTYIYPGSYR